MRTIIWLISISLVAVGASGQHTRFAQQRVMTPGIPPVNPIPPLGAVTPGAPFAHRFGFRQQGIPSAGFSAFPIFAGSYDAAYPPVNIIIVQPPASYVVVPEPPRETARPEIREYKQTAPTESAPTEEQPAFAIVLKDGTIHPAIAVSAQGDALHYVDPEGQHRRVSLEAIDREATRRLNRTRKLELRLPPPTPK